MSDKDLERDSLRALAGVLVSVDVPPDLVKAGMDPVAAQADVEERLQEAQIRTFESADAAAPATKYASPALSALVLTVPNESVPLDAYMVTLELRQLSSSLVTDELISGITWRCSQFGTIARGNVRDLQQVLDACVQEFVHDYRTVNPK